MVGDVWQYMILIDKVDIIIYTVYIYIYICVLFIHSIWIDVLPYPFLCHQCLSKSSDRQIQSFPCRAVCSRTQMVVGPARCPKQKKAWSKWGIKGYSNWSMETEVLPWVFQIWRQPWKHFKDEDWKRAAKKSHNVFLLERLSTGIWQTNQGFAQGKLPSNGAAL